MDPTLIRQFRRALRRFQRLNDVQLKSCCTRVSLPQCLVLLEVDEAEQPTMGQLATRLRLDGSTLSRTVESLVSRGLLERERSEQDRRTVRIRLTRSGRAECKTLHRDNDARCTDVLGRIPASRRPAVIRSFELLVQAYLDHEAESSRRRGGAEVA